MSVVKNQTKTIYISAVANSAGKKNGRSGGDFSTGRNHCWFVFLYCCLLFSLFWYIFVSRRTCRHHRPSHVMVYFLYFWLLLCTLGLQEGAYQCLKQTKPLKTKLFCNFSRLKNGSSWDPLGRPTWDPNGCPRGDFETGKTPLGAIMRHVWCPKSFFDSKNEPVAPPKCLQGSKIT